MVFLEHLLENTTIFLASSGYLELGLFDAALVLEEIAPEDKTRLEPRVNLYMAAKKWDMAAAIASHLVKVQPENAASWICFAYALRRTDCVENAEAILLRAQAICPEGSQNRFRPRPYACVSGRIAEARAGSRSHQTQQTDLLPL
jgi:lipopolysaccharide biosynthesis regulator YciM